MGGSPESTVSISAIARSWTSLSPPRSCTAQVTRSAKVGSGPLRALRDLAEDQWELPRRRTAAPLVVVARSCASASSRLGRGLHVVGSGALALIAAGASRFVAKALRLALHRFDLPPFLRLGSIAPPPGSLIAEAERGCDYRVASARDAQLHSVEALETCMSRHFEWAGQDLNLRPADFRSAARPAELPARRSDYGRVRDVLRLRRPLRRTRAPRASRGRSGGRLRRARCGRSAGRLPSRRSSRAAAPGESDAATSSVGTSIEANSSASGISSST